MDVDLEEDESQDEHEDEEAGTGSGRGPTPALLPIGSSVTPTLTGHASSPGNQPKNENEQKAEAAINVASHLRQQRGERFDPDRAIATLSQLQGFIDSEELGDELRAKAASAAHQLRSHLDAEEARALNARELVQIRKLTEPFKEVRFWDEPDDQRKLSGLRNTELIRLRGMIERAELEAPGSQYWQRQALEAIDREVNRRSEASQAGTLQAPAVDPGTIASATSTGTMPAAVEDVSVNNEEEDASGNGARRRPRHDVGEMPAVKQPRDWGAFFVIGGLILGALAFVGLLIWGGVYAYNHMSTEEATATTRTTTPHARPDEAEDPGEAADETPATDDSTESDVHGGSASSTPSYEEVRHAPGSSGRPECQRYSLASPGARNFSRAEWATEARTSSERPRDHWDCPGYPDVNRDGSWNVCVCDWVAYRRR